MFSFQVSKLTIAPIPQQEKRPSSVQTKSNSPSTQQQRISINYLPTQNPVPTTITAFYPTQRPKLQNTPKSLNNQQMTQHIHVPPPPAVPQLKPHQITINLSPPDIQRLVQNPSPLLPSQSRVIVTAKASVSDESGRPLNTSQLITLPLPTIPSNYDEYKEGDESFDPFYHDVPKIRNDRRIVISRKVEANQRLFRKKRSIRNKENDDAENQGPSTEEVIFNAEIKDIKDLKTNLPYIKAVLFGLPLPQSSDFESHVGNESTNIGDFLEENFTTEFPHLREIEENRSRIINSHSGPIFTRESMKRNLPPPFVQRKVNMKPIIVESHLSNADPKDTVQLFLNTTIDNYSILNNSNSSHNARQLNLFNETYDTDNSMNRMNQHKPEVLQTRSSSNSNSSNRRRYKNDDLSDESEEYLPRKRGRMKPRLHRYYDDYDVSESIESSTRQRSNRIRQRPKERRIYRDPYVDDDDEYDEENVNYNRKGLPRRGIQARRIPNGNRYYDYEDDIEVYEKPRFRMRNPASFNRNRARRPPERMFENGRRRPEFDRRRNGRRRPPLRIYDEDSFRNETDNVNSQNISDSNLNLTKDVNSHRLNDDNTNTSISTNNENDEQLKLVDKKRLDSLDKIELPMFVASRNQNRQNFMRHRLNTDLLDESVERFPYEYEDYGYYRPQMNRNMYYNRKYRNRYDSDFPLVPRRNSRRRNKSRKFDDIEKTEEDKNDDVTSTTTTSDEDITTILPSEETATDDATFQEYEDYSLTNTTSKLNEDNDIKTSTKESVTDGILKFTDELITILDKKNDQQNPQEVTTTEKENKSLSVTSDEDYIDDNYERDSYIEPKINYTKNQESNVENNKLPTILNLEKIQEKKVTNILNNITQSNNVSRTGVKEEYEDLYEDDKIETTTVGDEYYDSYTTSDDPLEVTTLSSIQKTTATSTTSSTTTTTTTTTLPTTTSTTTSAPTTIATPTTTTTKSKATAKFLKPTAFRKNYSYSLTSTTPNSVIIRRGQPLLGPKPTKIPLTYNEIAAKPVIRRLPLLSRTTTTTSEATILEEKIGDEITKKSVINTNSNDEERINSYSTTESQPLIYSKIETTTNSTLKLTLSTSKEYISDIDSSTESTNNQVLLRETSTITNKLRDENFDNEVGKQIYETSNTNNVPQKSDESYTDTSRSKDINGIKSNSNSEATGVRKTIVKTIRPLQRRKSGGLAALKTQNQKETNVESSKQIGFNCLEKEMYRFYGDVRDCRLFHYCSPGFTSRQVLDFRFVCEEGTIFDEETQSCRHDVQNPKCVKRTW